MRNDRRSLIGHEHRAPGRRNLVEIRTSDSSQESRLGLIARWSWWAKEGILDRSSVVVAFDEPQNRKSLVEECNMYLFVCLVERAAWFRITQGRGEQKRRCHAV
jgi:hypothetical protein